MSIEAVTHNCGTGNFESLIVIPFSDRQASADATTSSLFVSTPASTEGETPRTTPRRPPFKKSWSSSAVYAEPPPPPPMPPMLTFRSFGKSGDDETSPAASSLPSQLQRENASLPESGVPGTQSVSQQHQSRPQLQKTLSEPAVVGATPPAEESFSFGVKDQFKEELQAAIKQFLAAKKTSAVVAAAAASDKPAAVSAILFFLHRTNAVGGCQIFNYVTAAYLQSRQIRLSRKTEFPARGIVSDEFHPWAYRSGMKAEHVTPTGHLNSIRVRTRCYDRAHFSFLRIKIDLFWVIQTKLSPVLHYVCQPFFSS